MEQVRAAARAPARTGIARVGISGWTYPPWRGDFYPRGLAHARELAYASRIFSSIEINGTFYGLQTPESFARWAAETPDDFVFAVKGGRFVTHMKRLRDADRGLANFFASGVLRLGAKLGPFLWQLPPNFRFDAERIAAFLDALPRDTDAAAALARRHDARVAGRAWTEPLAPMRLRHAMEIRHDSFKSAAFVALLRRHGVALVCADSVAWPLLGDVTADFVYCRLHGSEELYASGYDDPALARWAARVRQWTSGGEPADLPRVGGPARRQKRDVFVYFDNDAKVRAPYDARSLIRRLAETGAPPETAPATGGEARCGCSTSRDGSPSSPAAMAASGSASRAASARRARGS
jgi:uncharacterized protein YecE (DUF72 family)